MVKVVDLFIDIVSINYNKLNEWKFTNVNKKVLNKYNILKI